MTASFVLMIFINVKIVVLKKTSIFKQIGKSKKISPTATSAVKEIKKNIFSEDNILADWSSLFLVLCFCLLFFTLNYKVNRLNFSEINLFPNTLYVYCHQLIAFQLLSLVMLAVLYSRHKEIKSTLLRALNG